MAEQPQLPGISESPGFAMSAAAQRRREQQLVETFLRAHEVGETALSPATRSKYRYNVQAWLKYLNGREPAPEILQTFGLSLKTEGLRPRTRHGYLHALAKFFGWLRATGRLKTRKRFDVKRLLDPGKLDEARVVWATDADVEALWQAADRLPYETLSQEFRRARALAVLAFCCYTGIRRDAILKLELRDIDCSGTPWTVTARVTKNRQSHWVPLPEDEHLHLLIEYWLEIRRRWCAAHEHESPLYFPVDRRRTLGNAGITRIFKDLCTAAGIKKAIRAHAFRRWYGSDIEKKHGLKRAQNLLGHSDIATTARYLRTSNQQELEAASNTLPIFVPARANPNQLPPLAPAHHPWPSSNGSNGHAANGKQPDETPPTGMHLWAQLLSSPEPPPEKERDGVQ